MQLGGSALKLTDIRAGWPVGTSVTRQYFRLGQFLLHHDGHCDPGYFQGYASDWYVYEYCIVVDLTILNPVVGRHAAPAHALS